MCRSHRAVLGDDDNGDVDNDGGVDVSRGCSVVPDLLTLFCGVKADADGVRDVVIVFCVRLDVMEIGVSFTNFGHDVSRGKPATCTICVVKGENMHVIMRRECSSRFNPSVSIAGTCVDTTAPCVCVCVCACARACVCVNVFVYM
jgi:hypothetical protein